MSQEPTQPSPSPAPSLPPPPVAARSASPSFATWFITIVTCLVIGGIGGAVLTHQLYFKNALDEKDTELEAAHQNIRTTRDDMLRDVKTRLVLAQDYLNQNRPESTRYAQAELIRAKEVVDAVRSLATEDADKSRIENLGRRLKDAEGRADRDLSSAKADIARALTDIDSLMGKTPSRRRGPVAGAK